MKAEMVLARAGEMISAGRVFGTPVEREGVTVVPIAWVIGGGGGGEGGPPGQEGDGAGFGVVSIPIGAYVIKNGDAKFVPTYDVGFLALIGAGLLKSLFKRRHRRRG
jgi:uncharacterized spore protein YtfJ